MRPLLLTCGAAALIGALLLTGSFVSMDASTGPIPLDCNRACLEGLVNQYLTALVAHNPSTLPLSKDLIYTENNEVLEIGDGFWKTVEGRGAYSHYFADPEGGQVAYMGTMKEAGGLDLLSLRILHGGRGAQPERCAGRDRLQCDGLPGAIQARLLLRGAEHSSSPLCRGGSGARHRVGAFRLRSRHRQQGRAEQRQAVRVQGFNRPSSILVTEAFLIENGKIRRVEMVGNSAPYHMNSPWPGNLSGN